MDVSLPESIDFSVVDKMHFSAAMGWFELGDSREAGIEISKLSYYLQSQPDVLLLKCKVYEHANQWGDARIIAKQLINLIPDELQGWLTLAKSISHLETDGCQAAIACLRSAEKIFSSNWRYFLTLAHYAILLGDTENAREWVWASMRLGGEESMLMKDISFRKCFLAF